MNKPLKATKIIFLVGSILLIGAFSGCSSESIETDKEGLTEPQKASFSNITPEEAQKRLNTEKEVVLLDVRTNEEYKTGHIKGSVLIPVDNLNEEAKQSLKGKEAPIFVYCRSGNRSVAAAKILVNLGYKNVYNLGGINDWPYEVVK